MTIGVKYSALPGVCSGLFLWNFKGQDWSSAHMSEQKKITEKKLETFLNSTAQTKFLLVVYDNNKGIENGKRQKDILQILEKWSKEKDGYVAKYLDRWTDTGSLWMIRKVVTGYTWETST